MSLCRFLRCYCVVDSFSHVLFVSRPMAPTRCAGSAAGPSGPEDRNNVRILKCHPRTACRRNARGAVRARKRPPTTMVTTWCSGELCNVIDPYSLKRALRHGTWGQIILFRCMSCFVSLTEVAGSYILAYIRIQCWPPVC